MNKTTANAKQLAASVLTEAFAGPVAGVLSKYHLLGPNGELRQFVPEGETAAVSILDPDVISRFLALDTSSSKKTFDWMMFASGGGEPHIRESERAIELAKNWVIENRMKGKDRNEQDIRPMSRQEAEADWQANDYPKYYEQYFFADQDLAADTQYPVFGWFRTWPGRHNVYEKVVNGITKWKALAGDKKFVQSFNRTNPKDPFHITLWDNTGKPRFKDADALLEYVGTVKSILARRRAETNVVTVGKNPEGGYRTGPDEVLYEDDVLKMYIPLTGAAALKKGFNDWCVANRSRWEEYFKSRQRNSLLWGTYTQRGPFAFLHIKKPLTNDRYLQTLAAHVQLDQNPNTPGRIQWWDRQNQAQVGQATLIQRLEREIPGSGRSIKTAVKELEEWLAQFKREQLEQFPALEAMAHSLVNELLLA